MRTTVYLYTTIVLDCTSNIGRDNLNRGHSTTKRHKFKGFSKIMETIVLLSIYVMVSGRRESQWTSLGDASVDPNLWAEDNLEIHLSVVAHGVSWAAVGHLVRVGPALG